MKLFFALFFATVYTVAAQTPQVPHKMEFAGMSLTIRDDARREIQKDVDALTASPRHHNIKVERAKTYFPLIQKVFEEENVPQDFKYLVLQESALIADAVSVSNAVGFWQFKEYTALEMGLRVDKEIDERLNIVSSSRAAARYIKKNNFYFNNWIYALQAYQMGAGGVMKAVDKTQSGASTMEINSSTYWYVKKFLAHKVAFEEAVKGEGQTKVVLYANKTRKNIDDLAREVSVDQAELMLYNKWVKKGTIPEDRQYMVLIPMKGDGKPFSFPEASPTVAGTQAGAAPVPAGASVASKASRIKINGIVALKAIAGESVGQLATRGGVSASELARWNDITVSSTLTADQYYLLGKKRARGNEAYHKVVAGEDLWAVSQQHGVTMKKLRRYNRLSSDSELKPGTTLWLSSMKPRDADKAMPAGAVVQVDNSQTFAWGTNGDGEQPTVSAKPTIVVAAPVATPVADTSIKPVERTDSAQTLQPKTVAAPPVDTAAQQTIQVIVPENKTEHVVKQGETVYAIAKAHNLAVMDLVTWNKLNLQEGIRPGQVLKLVDPQPVATVQPAVEATKAVTETEHEVKSTDTLYSIARKYNVTIKELMEWNNKKDFTLSIGERLKIKNK
ncbi:LysM peptidoglycan-binding domain-containing protein [Chryseolinea lacunae]|uniref:LysM peptidoglycan-binding domain-containing protein n=1 Tax=Chryseolinea lacunae TaxID=2801331 RepID=A0ABS1KNS3_9BACT|nr:LysM peptidoglycan-binding domain-containing protein [Chryseolinea lacunae]MBL0740892.1 LysM peptidoglycan-binding domain-containing protein [Chryseolinea lacunae]